MSVSYSTSTQTPGNSEYSMCVSSIGVSGIFPSPTLLKHLASLLKIVQIQEQKVTDCALNKLHGIERIMGFF